MILLAVVATVILWRSRSRHDRALRSAEAAIAANVPRFKLVALGLQGSGKTLLLASIYQEFLVPTELRSYYLKTSPDDANRLRNQYQLMADSSQPTGWPEGTTQSQTRQYEFSVRVQHAGVIREVMTLEYLEYA